MYTADPPFQTSLMQAAEGRQWWMLTFGSSKIRSCAVRSTSEHATHLKLFFIIVIAGFSQICSRLAKTQNKKLKQKFKTIETETEI